MKIRIRAEAWNEAGVNRDGIISWFVVEHTSPARAAKDVADRLRETFRAGRVEAHSFDGATVEW